MYVRIEIIWIFMIFNNVDFLTYSIVYIILTLLKNSESILMSEYRSMTT